jgi:hypothetical protein
MKCLYIYICKYFKFPIGHPAINVGDDCLDIDAMILGLNMLKWNTTCLYVIHKKRLKIFQQCQLLLSAEKRFVFCLLKVCLCMYLLNVTTTALVYKVHLCVYVF